MRGTTCELRSSELLSVNHLGCRRKHVHLSVLEANQWGCPIQRDHCKFFFNLVHAKISFTEYLTKFFETKKQIIVYIYNIYIYIYTGVIRIPYSR